MMNGPRLIAFGIWCLCLGQVVTQTNDNLSEKTAINSEGEKPLCGAVNVDLSDAERDEFLRAHNNARRREEATNMLQMVWDEGLAKLAQEKANTCIYNHSMFTSCDGVDLGQNLAADWSQRPLNFTKVTYGWANERENWDHTTKKCQQGKKCGHWIILTAATSWRLGCAKAKCKTLFVNGEDELNSNFVVCNYGPIGWEFDAGPRCSRCYNSTIGLEEKGYTCDNGLCVPCVPMRNPNCKCGPAYSCQNGGQHWADICSCRCPGKYYGTYCENPCDCVDTKGFNCKGYASDCKSKKYKFWLPKACQKTCDACGQFKRPDSCTTV